MAIYDDENILHLIDNVILCEYLHRTIAYLYLSPLEKVFCSFKAPFAACVFLFVIVQRCRNSWTSVDIFVVDALFFSFAWLNSKLLCETVLLLLKRMYGITVAYSYRQLIADNVDTAMCVYAAALVLQIVWTKRREIINYIVINVLVDEEVKVLNSSNPEANVILESSDLEVDLESSDLEVDLESSDSEKIQILKAQLMIYKEDFGLERKDLENAEGRIADLEQQLLALELEAVETAPSDMEEQIRILKAQLTIYKEDFGSERKDLESAEGKFQNLEQQLLTLELTAVEVEPSDLEEMLEILTAQLMLYKEDFDLEQKHHENSETGIADLEQQLLMLKSVFKRGPLEPSGKQNLDNFHGKRNDHECGVNVIDAGQPLKVKDINQCDQQMSALKMNDAARNQLPD